jgi:plastocyanin
MDSDYPDLAQAKEGNMPRRKKITTKSVVFWLTSLVFVLFILAVIAVITATQTKRGDVSNPSIPQATIAITTKGFDPAILTVKKGTKVIWNNNDTKMHQVVADPFPSGKSLPGLKSEILNKSQSYEYVANKKGKYGYHDQLNPATNGTLKVKD